MKYMTLLILLIWIVKADAQPNASFSLSRTKVCSGKGFSGINNSTGANRWQWKVDGVHYSSAFDTSFLYLEPCWDKKRITLWATDTISFTADSFDAYVEVFDSCFFHWTTDVFACSGDSFTLNKHPEATGTLFSFSSPQMIVAGCDTCPSITFVVNTHGLMVDRKHWYEGGCSEVTSFHYLCGLDVAGPEMEIPEVSVFPNPASSMVTVSSPLPIERIMVVDPSGRLVAETGGSDRSHTVDLSQYSPGVYFLRVLTGEQVVGKVLVKE